MNWKKCYIDLNENFDIDAFFLNQTQEFWKQKYLTIIWHENVQPYQFQTRNFKFCLIFDRIHQNLGEWKFIFWKNCFIYSIACGKSCYWRNIFTSFINRIYIRDSFTGRPRDGFRKSWVGGHVPKLRNYWACNFGSSKKTLYTLIFAFYCSFS